ncbi:MAG: hypothetical protein QG614_139 [Patescibacteria group bacterium]|nr:hypothetical protein [Patescibacteria group bacterium]
MNNTELKGKDIFLNGKKVFLIVDINQIQNIADINHGRDLNEEELDYLLNYVIPTNETFELESYLLECINTAILSKSRKKNKEKISANEESFGNSIPTDF